MSVENGTWVRQRSRGVHPRGFVAAIDRRKALVRWVGKTKGEWVSRRSLVGGRPPRILVLEAALDPDLHSPRSQRAALENWCASSRVRIAFKNVLGLEDLAIIAESIGRERPPFLHLSCHGDHDEVARTYLLFAPRHHRRRRIYLDAPETIAAFQAFAGMSVFVSACLLGRYRSQVAAFRAAARLRHVAVFTRAIVDHEAMVFDLALYHAMLHLGLSFPAAVARARRAVEVLGIRGVRGNQLVRVL